MFLRNISILLTIYLVIAQGHIMALPPYVNIDTKTRRGADVLHKPAQKLTFPLSMQDQLDIQILEQKFDSEQNCAGLAAPQLGIGKQIIVLSAPDNALLKKWRADFTQTMDKQIWINPSYEAIGLEKIEDYEGCFSGGELAGPVQRFRKIRYHAYDPQGKEIIGIAEGFLARIIQHEIDHIHGQLFTDLVPEEQILTISEYRRKRLAAMATHQVVTIFDADHSVLATPATPMLLTEDGLHEAQIIADHLFKVLIPLMPAAGLAAPQVGLPRQMFIYSWDRSLEHMSVVINPKILEFSPDTYSSWESCFSTVQENGSAQAVYVARSQYIIVEYIDLSGKSVRQKLSGFAAKVFQHEYDHLHGIIDTQKNHTDLKNFASKQELLDFMVGIKKADSLDYSPPVTIVICDL